MSDLAAVQLRALADELDAIASAVPGVVRLQPRLGVGRFAKRLTDGLAAVKTGSGSALSRGPRVTLTVGATATVVELDVAVGREHSGPTVVRAVATAVLGRLALEPLLPPATVDVRIVAVG